MRNAYYDFVKGVIAGMSSAARKLQGAEIGDGSTDIYDFVDTPCPENDLATTVTRQAEKTCITVFGKYQVQVDEDEDAEEVYETYVEATQQAISEGDLDEALNESVEKLQNSTNGTAADFDFAVLGVSDVVDENFKPFAQVPDDSMTPETGDETVEETVEETVDETGTETGTETGDDESDDEGDDDLFGLGEVCETQEAARKTCFDSNECGKCEDDYLSDDDTDDTPSALDEIDPTDPDSIKTGLTTFLEDTCILYREGTCSATKCCPKCEAEIEASSKCFFDLVGPATTGLLTFTLGLGGADVSDIEAPDVKCNVEDACSGAVAVVGNMIAAMLTAGSLMLMLL